MSFASGLIDGLMKRIVNKKIFEDDEKFAEYLDKKKKANNKVYYLKYHFPKQIIVESQKFQGMRYFVFNRINCKKTIFYYHGGSYVDKPNLFHFRLIEKLLLSKEVCIVFPIYPRLPENDSKCCYEKLNELFDDFISKNHVEKIVFMGDSAGGGLALSMAQQIKVRHKYFEENKQKVVLLSPWLDMSLDNPQIQEIEKNDYQLSKLGLLKLGRMWACGNTKLAPASPLYGDVNCGKITIIIGTRDILYPDNLALKEKVENMGLPIKFYPFNNMAHCFMLMPIPEADVALKKILKAI